MESEETNLNEHKISQMAIFHLKSTVVWMKIFAIFLFTAAAWILFMVTQLGRYDAEAIPWLVIGIALYGLMGYLLLTAANKFNSYIESNEKLDLEEALSKQKTYWIVMGILGIMGMLAILIFFIYFLQYGGRF